MLSIKAQKALEVLKAGGEFRYRLETNSYTRRSQWQASLVDGDRQKVRGFAMATFYELKDAGFLAAVNTTSVSTYYRLAA